MLAYVLVIGQRANAVLACLHRPTRPALTHSSALACLSALSHPNHSPNQAPVVRFYSLSDAPNGRHYRITVKKEPHGVVSTYLHTHVTTGSMLEVMVRTTRIFEYSNVDASVDYIEPGGRCGTLSCLLGPALSFSRHWSLSLRRPRGGMSPLT